MKIPAPGFAPFLALALLGFALVLAIRTAEPGPRTGSRTRLIDLIEREDDRARVLRGRLDELNAELDAIERRAAVGKGNIAELTSSLAGLGSVAGTEAVEGPGVRVELRDSTLDRSPAGDPNDLVIHEQDLQSIVNALWSGGAEGIAINGERLTATSAVRCVGNTLLLHGTVYAPPYRIDAIGDAGALMRALDQDALVERFRVLADTFNLGFDVARAERMQLPAFGGLVTTRHARVV